MPLVFSPLSEAVLQHTPSALLPKTCFVLKQLGDPSKIDLEIIDKSEAEFSKLGYNCIDATFSNSGKDYLDRILSLIRSTSFTVAIFSSETRPTALANIFLELGFAAMCGKPIVIIKDKEAIAPSDIKRTDWIEFDGNRVSEFSMQIVKATNQISMLADWELDLLTSSREAYQADLGIAVERAMKGFLINPIPSFMELLQEILSNQDRSFENNGLSDLERISGEARVFIRQAQRFLSTTSENNKVAE